MYGTKPDNEIDKVGNGSFEYLQIENQKLRKALDIEKKKNEIMLRALQRYASVENWKFQYDEYGEESDYKIIFMETKYYDDENGYDLAKKTLKEVNKWK